MEPRLSGISYLLRLCEDMRDATRIILLHDPEFLTAANARKQYLLNMLSMKQAYGPMHRMMLCHAVRSELWFLTSILTSPLHRQSKSPTLWWQRAWIYQTFCDELPALFEGKDWIVSELEVVLKAAEMHQHNYYAFQYARRVLPQALKFLVADEKETTVTRTSQIHQAVTDRLLLWCKAHPGDTSGWSFLEFWLRSHPQHSTIIPGVLKYATNMSWQGEALWSFLRNIASDETRADPVKTIRPNMLALCPRLVRTDPILG